MWYTREAPWSSQYLKLDELELSSKGGVPGRGGSVCKGMDDRTPCGTHPCLLIPTSESSPWQSPLIAYALKYGLHGRVSSNFGLYFGHCR